MSIITMTETEKKRLERKAKAGWCSYYAQLERFSNLSAYVRTLTEQNRDVRERINNTNGGLLDDNDITHLKNQFIEMYDKLKEYSGCPICFEIITKDTAKLGNCGHLVCVSCYERIDKCPTCRKSYYKRPNP